MVSVNDATFVKFVVVVWLSISVDVFTPIYGDRILFLPANVDSHVLYLTRLAADLAELGHTTTVVAPSNARVPDFTATIASGKFRYVTYWFFGPRCSPGNCQRECSALDQNDDLMRQIRYGGFQFAVLDHHAAPCYCTIPYSLGIPYGKFITSSFSSTHVHWIRRTAFGEQPIRFSVAMDQLQQQKYIYCVSDGSSVDTVQLMRQTSLWFVLEHVAVSYVHPLMPNTVAVGDIMAGRPGKALPHELEKFISAGWHNVMLVSLEIDVSPEVLVTFCDAFRGTRRRRPRLRVIWRTEETEICSGEEHIMLVPWIPQNDLLAHPRVVMFISDGGFNSIVESVYHAKPLIIFSNFSDQWLNAAAAESKGFAVQLHPYDFNSESILATIAELYNPRYRSNALLASAMLRDQRDTPAQRVSAMIDHVIKYGDRHLRTEVLKLSEFTMSDIFDFLKTLPLFIVLPASVLFLCVGCCSCSGCCYWFSVCVKTCEEKLKME